MKKKNRRAMTALAIMLSCSLLSGTAVAGQLEETPGAAERASIGELTGTKNLNTTADIPVATETPVVGEETPDKEDKSAAMKVPETTNCPEKTSDSENQDTAAEMPEATNNSDTDGVDVVSLQIPQKLGVVIDPWEVAGKGQIYSEPYTIRNTGEEAGILTLSFLCRKGEGSVAVIRTDTIGLHDDENKSIYIEMIFGDAERIILTEEGLKYQAELQPGEELSVSFAGEVNEYASEGWGDADVEIEGVYFWNVAESVDAVFESDVEEPEEASSPEAEDAVGTEGKTAADGNVLPGNDSAEGTDSSVADEPAEGSEGQDGDVKGDSEDEPKDGEEQNDSSDSKDASDGNRAEETDAAQSGAEPAEPAVGEESGSLSTGEDGEKVPEEGEEISAPKVGDDSFPALPMEDNEDETESGTEDMPETLPGNVEYDL